MSLELIDITLIDWSNPNYGGLQYDPETMHIQKYKIDDYINDKIIKDIEQVRFLKIIMKSLHEYGHSLNDLIEFYKGYNMIFGTNKDLMYVYKIESGLMQEELEVINRYITKNTNKIIQVGFDSGIVAVDILNKTDAEILSFDLYDKAYSFYGNRFIEEKFPDRHFLIVGPYDMMIKTLQLGKPNRVLYDLIWINETSYFYKIYDAIINLKAYATSETILLMNNICPHSESGFISYMVMNKLIYENVVIFVKHIKIGNNYDNGIAVLKFNFKDIKEPTKLSPIVYKDIEIKMPLKEFKYYLTNNREDPSFDKQQIQIYIKKFKAQNIPLDEETVDLLRKVFGTIP